MDDPRSCYDVMQENMDKPIKPHSCTDNPKVKALVEAADKYWRATSVFIMREPAPKGGPKELADYAISLRTALDDLKVKGG